MDKYVKVKSEQEDFSAEQKKESFTFTFCYNKESYDVTCDRSMTILDALRTNTFFRDFHEKNKEKEILIQRRDPNSTVTPGFPCYLIGEGKIVDITFEKLEKEKGQQETTPTDNLSYENDTICFYIEKKGGKGIRMVLKDILVETPYVCVYAFKGEEVKAALKRDGRFKDEVFENGALRENNSKTITDLSNIVDRMGGKTYQVIKTTKLKSKPVKAEKKACKFTFGEAYRNQSNGQTSDSSKNNPKFPAGRDIPYTEEIRQILRNQHENLLKKLKERENLTDEGVRKYLQVEYGKKVQDFWEVKKMKKLMDLSKFVCHIRLENKACGTGFLLFDRFILTNAHVLQPEWENKDVTAVFNDEELGKGVKVKQLITHSYGQNKMRKHLDFALLELEKERGPGLMELCGDPPNSGAICIIGHPGTSVKRMDPCVVIPKGGENEAVSKHLTENQEFIHVILNQNILLDIKEDQVTCSSCSFHGSSGSPVFDVNCKLIGIHTGGYEYPGKQGEANSLMEYAFPMRPILEAIRMQCSDKTDIMKHFYIKNSVVQK